MNARNIVELKTFSRVTPVGTLCNIGIPKNMPHVAIIDDGERKIKAKSMLLGNYFEEFLKFTDDDIHEILHSDDSLSLTGKIVEPDGWDEHGTPSILLSIGMI